MEEDESNEEVWRHLSLARDYFDELIPKLSSEVVLRQLRQRAQALMSAGKK